MFFLVLEGMSHISNFCNVLLTLEELILISPAKTDVSVHPWTCWEKICFSQSFASKHQFFCLQITVQAKK